MFRLLTSMAAFAAVLALAACGGGGSKPAQKPAEPIANTAPTPEPAAASPQTPTQRAMAKMRDFTVAMCACKDADCAKRVSDDMTKWAQAEAAASTEPVKMNEDEMKEATEIGMRMGECMQTAMGINAGATP